MCCLEGFLDVSGKNKWGGQVITDANTVQKAVDRFNNQSIKAGVYPDYDYTSEVQLLTTSLVYGKIA